MSMGPIEAVVAEAKSRGLSVDRITGTRKNTFDSRLLYIEKKPCQVVKTALDSTSPEYAYAKSLPLYLPRTSFADFIIYVTMDSTPPCFYIIPRGVLSHDTSRTTESLDEYRNAWDLLTANISPALKERRFESISSQLQSVVSAAQREGLEVELIRTEKGKKRSDYRSFFQRRALIAGKRCAIYSAVRVNKNIELNQYSIVVLKVSTDSWTEFRLYLAEDGAVYIIPRDKLTHTTTFSLNSLDLRPYRKAWDLLRDASIRHEFY